MKSWHIGIAGGGIGGIISALLLAKDGHRITLHEKSQQLGGRLCFEEMGSYRIDQGPTIVLLPELLLNGLKEAGVDLSRVELIPCHPMYRIHYRDGTTFDKWSDMDQQIAEISRVFPGDENGFKEYMAHYSDVFPKGKRAFLDRPFLKRRQFLTRENIALLLRMKAFRSVRSQSSRYFTHQRLIDAFSLQTLYIGGAPHLTPALYTFIPFAEHQFGVWYVKGGYASLIPVLLEALERAGVEILYGSSIRDIVIKHGAATGLSTGKSYYPYDAVIYNGDLPHLYGLLPQIRQKTPAFTPSSGCLLIYLGVKKRWLSAKAHQFFMPDDFEKGMVELFRDAAIPKDPSYYIFNPTAIDPDAAPEGESVLYVMIPVPPAHASIWKAEGEKSEGRHGDQGAPLSSFLSGLIERVLEDAEQRAFPGLRDAIAEQRIRTPLHAEQSGLYQGGSFGIAPTYGQSGPLRPQLKPLPVERLYAVGASIHPGGGVPVVMQGAKLLADAIRKETL